MVVMKCSGFKIVFLYVKNGCQIVGAFYFLIKGSLNRKRYRHVGYLRHGFDFFLNGFACMCVPTLVSLVPSRTWWALSIPKKNFQKYPLFTDQKSKKLQKNTEKTWKLLKNTNGFASLASSTVPRLVPDRARWALSIPIIKVSLSSSLPPKIA